MAKRDIGQTTSFSTCPMASWHKGDDVAVPPSFSLKNTIVVVVAVVAFAFVVAGVAGVASENVDDGDRV